MRYRKFGNLHWKASALGFGIMRMPVLDRDYGRIDADRAKAMVRGAIDSGVNYLDTAWNYHRDNSEGFLGSVLEGGYRDRVRIATKMPCWLVETREDLDRFFDTQMSRLGVDHIDFYLLHALQRDWWDKLKGLGYIEWAEKKVAAGHIGHLGFSFHDKFPLFKRIIDEYDGWTMTMLQHNYMDRDREAGMEGIRYAAERGLAIVAMEPLRGGQLAKEPPKEIAGILKSAAPDRSPAEWGLRWLWDQEEITLVLSGMSAEEQVSENIRIACETYPGCLSEGEAEVIEEVRQAYGKRAGIPCTDCRYCMPCPSGVAIPFIFEYLNIFRMYDDLKNARAHYSFLNEANRADRCNACGKCLEHCPQHLRIIELLKECDNILKPDVPAS